LFSRKRTVGKPATAVPEPTNTPGMDVLVFLAEQGLAPTPSNYALGYHRGVDRRSLVAMSVDSILMDGRRITQADADRIMASHHKRALAGEPNEMAMQQQALRHQTLQLAELTAGAASGSGDFSRDLSEGLHRLSGRPNSTEEIVAAMIDRTRGVEAQLSAASKKIEQLRTEVEAVRGDAMRDALTGLLNRRGLTKELRSGEKRAMATVAICDVDHFKMVNDRHGHAVGDRVLKGVAASLAESLGAHQVARWGGEEFVVLLEGLAPDQSVPLLEKAREDLAARSFKLQDSGVPLGQVTISIGAAALQGSEPEAAIEAADRLLYAAKAGGRNRVIT
jgi:diguanylate cyclase